MAPVYAGVCPLSMMTILACEPVRNRVLIERADGAKDMGTYRCEPLASSRREIARVPCGRKESSLLLTREGNIVRSEPFDFGAFGNNRPTVRQKLRPG